MPRSHTEQPSHTGLRQSRASKLGGLGTHSFAFCVTLLSAGQVGQVIWIYYLFSLNAEQMDTWLNNESRQKKLLPEDSINNAEANIKKMVVLMLGLLHAQHN